MKLDDLSPIARAQALAKMNNLEWERDKPSPLVSILRETTENGRESALQRDAERWLEFHGWWRLTKGNIDAGIPPRGWQFHMPKPQGNPLLLDLLILGNNGRYLHIELKTKGGRVLKHQQQLVAQGATLCRSMDELTEAVKQWEDEA